MKQPHPKVFLFVQSNSETELEKHLQQTLSEYFRRNGFHLVNSPSDPETIILNIALVQLTGNPAMKLQWSIRRNGSLAKNRLMGSRLISNSEPLSEKLKKLGTQLAHEAAQL